MRVEGYMSPQYCHQDQKKLKEQNSAFHKKSLNKEFSCFL